MAMDHSFYARKGKRWFDASASFLGLFLLSPFLLLVAIAVRLTSPGPAIFRQWRMGRLNRPFRILKFRTMKVASIDAGPLLTAEGDSRITWLGRWLRRTKTDELLQLWNVLSGEMSLVGPRPEVPRYTENYSEAQKKVFKERPGITGPSIIFDEEKLMASRADKENFYLTEILPAKLEIDLAYCQSISFRSDLRFLFLTVTRLFRPASSRVPSVNTIEHLDRKADPELAPRR